MLDELRHFLLIAEHGTFTEAARRAHLSQPALSASVRRLEERMGARLLDRGRHGAVPTAAGEVLVPRARATLAAFEDGIRAVGEVQGIQRGVARIGGGATACTYLLPKTLATFSRRHPQIEIRVREGFTDELMDALHDGALDLAIVTGRANEPWQTDELIVFASPKIDPKRAGFITFPPGSPTREILLERFRNADVVMELASIAAVKGHVRAGLGKALLSRHAVKRDLSDGSLVEVRTRRTPVVRTLSLAHRGVERLPPATAKLREMLLARRSK
jgi:DNA-binding transcriptional LysR family regulator